MKKNYYLLAAVLFSGLCSWQVSYAQSYYKVHHINENFDNLTALPQGWSGNYYGSKTNCLFSKNGIAPKFENGSLVLSGAGSGGRGTDIIFPSPEIENAEKWFVEFDWSVEKATQGPKNAVGMVLSGSTSLNIKTDSIWYAASILGLYSFGDGYLHYWNMDLYGPNEVVNDKYSVYDGKMGPVFVSGNTEQFRRTGRNLPDDPAANNSIENVTLWHSSTKTDIAYRDSAVYHITACLNFKTQKVESLTISEIGNIENSQTIESMPFLAPSLVGEGAPNTVEERVVGDLSILSSFNTRGAVGSSGDGTDYSASFDNLEIYYQKASAGQAIVSVNYKDQDGNEIRQPRTLSSELNEQFSLNDFDKTSFISDGFYYAYNESETQSANSAKGDDGMSLIVSAGSNELSVIFKKFTAAAGTYMWKGTGGPIWSELIPNFQSGEITGLGYQNGNPVEFSNATPIKTVIVHNDINMADADITVTGSDYKFMGEGKINGTGALIVNGPASLEFNNLLEGGAIINSTEEVIIKNTSAASKFKIGNNGYVTLEAQAAFSTHIEGSGEGTSMNVGLAMETKGRDVSSKFTNASNLNMIMKVAGKLIGSTWDCRWSSTYENGMQLNIINGMEKDTLAGFSGISANISNVKIHLGDSIRFVRNYNEKDKEVTTIGELSGTKASILEGGFVGGRTQSYSVGNLNTDAVFEGQIRQFLKPDGELRTDNTLTVNKIGTGTWTLKGELSYIGYLNVFNGTLEVLGKVNESVSSIVVEEEAILKTGANDILSSTIVVNPNGKLIAQGTNMPAYLQIDGTLQGSSKINDITVTEGGNLQFIVKEFSEGKYDCLEINGSATMVGGSSINLIVNKSVKDAKIKLITLNEGSVTYPAGAETVKVFVNGVDITSNTAQTEGAEFVWNPATCELTALNDNEYDTAIDEVINNGKSIRFIEYYDIFGRNTTKGSTGIIIRKIIFNDNTTSVEKIIVR